MRERILTVCAVALVTGLLTVSTGCVRVPLSDTQKVRTAFQASTETTSAPLGDAQRAKATIRLGVGDLKMSGVSSATAAFTAKFTYAPRNWKPKVAFRTETVEGTPTAALYIDQPEMGDPMNLANSENAWELTLANGVPTDLSLKLGVGQSDVDLRDVDVRSLELATGVGDTTIDLSGPRVSDVAGTIATGVGQTVVRLPRDVGVRITGGVDGLGDISSKGFTRSGAILVNDAWRQPGPKIELRITRGVGDITFELVE